MRKRQNVRLIDIAKEVGCTVNTVSRALRDKDDIGRETKLKIKEVTKRLGYIPNSLASSLRSGYSYTVAIIFDNLINPYYMIMTDKIHRYLDELGYATMVYTVHDYKFNMEVLNPILSRKIDGIITFLEPSSEVVSRCKKNNVPIMLLGRKCTQLPIDSVSTDDYLGGFKVGEFLIEKGVKNVGYIGAPEEIECSVRRQKGLRDAYLKHNLPFDEKNIRYMKSDSTIEEIDILLENGVDGIFFFNDVIAFEGIKYLRSRNISIPEQIKVVGYDDIARDFPIPYALTSVSSDRSLIVKTAVEILYDRMRGKNKAKENKVMELAVELRIGNTT